MIPKTSTTQLTEYLEAEADAIEKVASQLEPEHVERALNFLTGCTGKVIVIGVGKSGIIAQKIAATFCSIGTVALALHPCDALHGDLGVMTSQDVTIVLSNSGETEEILALIPHLEQRRVPLIAIVGNLTSSLARQADVILDATIDREICPLNLAPTTSTTVALALGDALAMALMQNKHITPQNFAENHPSGRLGKRLTLRVRHLMHSGTDNPVLPPDATWIDVVGTITRGGMGAVNIIDEAGCLAGVITDGDLRRWIQKSKPTELEYLQAKHIMTQHPVVVSPDELVYDALTLMENRPSQISVLSVVDDQQRCLGLLRLHDVVRSGL
ncbi:KpsF/GutQ family sugar-phosphate isomerase [candidate division KSB3 bacterium]|uniref:KpsF/GutQ family sugar-phosphate isomerase n=1 Tax=candidate division KSB3 bacterium TaxID=2044937 RepID=A0A2G6KK11_9BACT|nr:MAG: KpsF/GutQ family sugar-phosphate isomerase [candidate division KSB3 bacterium]